MQLGVRADVGGLPAARRQLPDPPEPAPFSSPPSGLLSHPVQDSHNINVPICPAVSYTAGVVKVLNQHVKAQKPHVMKPAPPRHRQVRFLPGALFVMSPFTALTELTRRKMADVAG